MRIVIGCYVEGRIYSGRLVYEIDNSWCIPDKQSFFLVKKLEDNIYHVISQVPYEGIIR